MADEPGKSDKLLAQAWERFCQQVIPTAPEYQVESMRKAFYAGAALVFGTLLEHLSAGPDPAASDFALLDAIDAELKEFLIETKRAMHPPPAKA